MKREKTIRIKNPLLRNLRKNLRAVIIHWAHLECKWRREEQRKITRELKDTNERWMELHIENRIIAKDAEQQAKATPKIILPVDKVKNLLNRINPMEK